VTTAKNAIYAQSGGVTAVINASAAGVLTTARRYPEQIGRLLAAVDGITGLLHEELLDLYAQPEGLLDSLHYTPSAAFGSCRHKLPKLGTSEADAVYERLLAVFKAHNVGYFFYNGGGDSQDTANKIAEFSHTYGYPIVCMGIPKTIDNDLECTDNSPGFASVAKYVATATLEAGFDVAAMARTSTKVFIMEVMGRHAGFIAASAGLAHTVAPGLPLVILVPEVTFVEQNFLQRVASMVASHGYCIVVAAEGIKNSAQQFLAAAQQRDAFGHAQLGGVAPMLAALVQQKLGHKVHWAVCDYLQRVARHTASAVDVEQAYAVGAAAVELAMQGQNARMPVIQRLRHSPYTWKIDSVALAEVANREKLLPTTFLQADGFGINASALEYFLPLIQGEAVPPYSQGLPAYVSFPRQLLTKQLPGYR
jgi:6-phosphofructokinase